MSTELNKKITYYQAIIPLFVLSVLTGVASAFLGEVMLPFCAAFYAAVVLYEKKNITHRIFSAAAPVAIIIINVAMGNYIPVVAVEAAVVGLAIAFTYAKGMKKSESVFIVTAIITVMTLLSLMLASMVAKGSFSFDAVTLYYTELYESLKDRFVSYFIEAFQAIGDGAEIVLSTAEITQLFDRVVDMLISVLFLVAFTISGATFKIFTVIIYKCSDKPEEVMRWRFMTTSIFAYTAVAFMLLSTFLSSGTDVFSIAVCNLSNIFTFIFAYLGFNYVTALLSARRGGGISFILLVVVILMLASFALQLLAVLGIVLTVQHNKFINRSAGSDTGSGNINP